MRTLPASAALLAALSLTACLAKIDDSLADKANPAPTDDPKKGGSSSGSSDVTPTPGGSTPTSTPASGMLGYWSFDDVADGKVPDASGRGHDGQLAGSPGSVAGVKGQALAMTGAETFDVPSLAGAAFPAEGTLSLHMKMPLDYTSTATDWGVFDVGDHTRSHVALYPVANGDSSFFALFGRAQGYPIVSFDIKPDAWQWIVVTWSATRGEVFVDGASQGTADLIAFSPTDQRVVFGTAFHGVIDEVALYDHAFLPPETR